MLSFLNRFDQSKIVKFGKRMTIVCLHFGGAEMRLCWALDVAEKRLVQPAVRILNLQHLC